MPSGSRRAARGCRHRQQESCIGNHLEDGRANRFDLLHCTEGGGARGEWRMKGLKVPNLRNPSAVATRRRISDFARSHYRGVPKERKSINKPEGDVRQAPLHGLVPSARWRYRMGGCSARLYSHEEPIRSNHFETAKGRSMSRGKTLPRAVSELLQTRSVPGINPKKRTRGRHHAGWTRTTTERDALQWLRRVPQVVPSGYAQPRGGRPAWP